jgi:hypothetical protein
LLPSSIFNQFTQEAYQSVSLHLCRGWAYFWAYLFGAAYRKN